MTDHVVLYSLVGMREWSVCYVPVAFWLLMRCLVGPLRTAIKLLSYLFMDDRTPSMCMYEGSVVHLSNYVELSVLV